MNEPFLAAPGGLVARYAGWEWAPVSCYAEQTTWRLDRPDRPDRPALFLKVRRSGAYPDLLGEAARTRWAAAHLPVPVVVELGTDGTVEWLVTEAIPGRPATDPGPGPGEPRQVVVALAEGLRRFHDSVPVAGCPFDFRVATAMAHVRRRHAEGLIDPAEDFDEEHQHLDAAGALHELERLQPDSEDLVVCHGDYCPPNVLVTGGRVTGYVDLGELGVADRWWDLGVATRAVTWNYGSGYEPLFLAAYGAVVDRRRQAFYRLLYDTVS